MLEDFSAEEIGRVYLACRELALTDELVETVEQATNDWAWEGIDPKHPYTGVKHVNVVQGECLPNGRNTYHIFLSDIPRPDLYDGIQISMGHFFCNKRATLQLFRRIRTAQDFEYTMRNLTFIMMSGWTSVWNKEKYCQTA